MRRIPKSPIVTFVSGVLLSTAVLALCLHIQGAAAPIDQIRSALNRIKPFKVNFVQQVFTDEDMDIQESGEIIFNHDRQLKWTYLDPDYKVFLLEGDEYRFYDEDNEQLTIGRVKEKNSQWIWRLLFSDDVLPHTRWNSQESVLYFKNSKESLDVQIQVDAAWLPAKVTQRDPSGAKMVFLFQKYREKIPVDKETFVLKVPQNVEIIHDEK